MRILVLGDVVGRTGRDTVAAALPGLRTALRVDLAIVNAENASHGFGLSPDMAQALFAAGADVLTLGNHAWDRKEIIPYIAETPRLLRAVNFPPGTPGAGSVVVTLADGRKALVMQAMGLILGASGGYSFDSFRLAWTVQYAVWVVAVVGILITRKKARALMMAEQMRTEQERTLLETFDPKPKAR